MKFRDDIEVIEKRAGKLNLSLRQLCLAARVEYVTVHRWKARGANPKILKLEWALGRLEKKLTELEAAMRKALADEKPPRRRRAA